jgi:hypothetical protein
MTPIGPLEENFTQEKLDPTHIHDAQELIMMPIFSLNVKEFLEKGLFHGF